MTLASDLRNIVAAARPTVTEWLDISEQFVGFREACKAKGIDWSQVKALIKAQVQDERDGGRRVEKIVEKADFASSYAAMLGLLPENMNEENNSESLDGITADEVPASDASASPKPASGAKEAAGDHPTSASEPITRDAENPRAGSARTEPARGTIHDDEEIPTFLRRGHPDCQYGAQGRG